jgi:CPA1 family monovalent cation:H+ antiporter
MWEIGDFLLTGISFILMGLQLPRAIEGVDSETNANLILATGAVCATVILVRPLWIFGVGWLTSPLRPRNPDGTPKDGLKTRGLMVISYSGMRGVISLALALSLPATLPNGAPFPGRGLIIVVTFFVILVTLVGQGLTLPFLIRRLRVVSSGKTAALAEMRAQVRLALVALQRIDEMADAEEANGEALARVRRIFAERLETVERRCNKTGQDATPEGQVEAEAGYLLHEMVKLQHEELQEMRRSGEIDTPTALRLQRRLDATDRLRIGI